MTNVPIIIWELDGTKHYHYVDIFIEKQIRCIEVKSQYTINQQGAEKVFAKQQAGRDAGYAYEIWVFYDKGIIVEKYL
jgi:hypothetical protein